MTVKQIVRETLESLPESASWKEIADALFVLSATNGTLKEAVRFSKLGETVQDLRGLINVEPVFSADEVLAELEELVQGKSSNSL